MTATQTPPLSQIGQLVAGVRAAVERHADWAETAQLVADELRRHLPSPGVLTAEQRLGSPRPSHHLVANIHSCSRSPAWPKCRVLL